MPVAPGPRVVVDKDIDRLCAYRPDECGEAGECGGQVVAPGPVRGDAQPGAALTAGDAGCDVQQPVTQRLGLALARSPLSRVVWVQAIRSLASSKPRIPSKTGTPVRSTHVSRHHDQIITAKPTLDPESQP